MPVNNTSSLAGPFIPNGSTTLFPFGFNAQAASDVAVFDGNGVAVSSALYTVALYEGDGGTVTFGTAPIVATYAQLWIALVPSFAQTADFTNAGPTYNPAQLTAALDAIASRIIALKGETDRALKVPRGETPAGMPGVSARAGRLLAFDLSGNPVAGPPAVPAAPVDRENMVLTLEQFGGAAEYASPGDRGTDNFAALMEALDAINRYAPVNARWARVPRIELGLGAYFFGERIEQKVAAHLRGQGSGHDDFNGGTRLVFPTGVKGITVNDSNTLNGGATDPTTSALGTVIEGVQIESEGGGTGWDTTKGLNDADVLIAAATNTCGLWVRATCTLRDVVLKGWKGNAVQIVGDVSQAGALRGNASGTIIDRLTVREDDAGTPSGGYGVFVYGKDVNACDFSNVQVRHAGLAGIVDAATLGNTWTNPRVDDFGRVARATSAAELGCYYTGVNYILIDDHPGLGASTTPGTNSQIWYPLETAGAASALFPAWSGSANYVCMLPFLFVGQSNTGTVENPYIEGSFPGHAGGNPASPGTGVSVYSGQSQWTRFTSRIYSVPSYGRAMASNSGFLSRRISDIGSAEVTDFGAYSQARIGSSPGEIWAGRTARDSETDYAMRFTTGGELVMDRGGGGLPLMRISTALTARQFGTGANVPYVVSFPNFALSDPADGGNDRRVSMGAAAPTSGAWARGDIVFNVAPSAGGKIGWVCVTAGSPGTWKPFGAIDA